MKKYFKEHQFDLLIIFLFAGCVLLSLLFSFKPVIEIAQNNFLNFVVEMFSFLPALFILIGLFDVWVPKETITKHIGEESGLKGTVIVIFLAMLQAGPLYGAFPVAHLLWKKGISVRNVFIYLGAFSTLKIPMLTFETAFLGVKFSLLRTLVTIPVFIAIGVIMERYLKNRDFEIHETS